MRERHGVADAIEQAQAIRQRQPRAQSSRRSPRTSVITE
jgi:hypothetical protein